MSDNGIVVRDLVKEYPGEVMAVNGVSFQVREGEIFGFLGPNGAGKSTVVKILTSLGLPTAGQAWVGGYDVIRQAGEVRGIVGVTLQDVGIDPLMKPHELLQLQGRLFGMGPGPAARRAGELIDLVGLKSAADRRVGTFSGGMKRRLDLALSLVHKPRFLFLDEPTTGLDPASRRDVWKEVRRLNRELGMTIFLTTQYLEEADVLADRIAIIDQGEIQVTGSPAKLKASLGKESLNLLFQDRQTAQDASDLLQGKYGQAVIDRESLILYKEQAAELIPDITHRLSQGGYQPLSITLTQPDLDDVFLHFTGETIQQENHSPANVEV